MYIDSHFHIWSLERGDYDWLTPQLPAIYRDFGIADWRIQFGELGVSGGILVQAAPTDAETAFLLEQAARHADTVLGVVGWADFERSDAPAHIQSLAADRRLVGLRPMLQDLPDPAWIARPSIQPALQAMSSAALTLDALVRPVHLPYIDALAKRYPELTIVIDHAAKPAIATGRDRDAWLQELRALAAYPSVYCKLSGLWTEAAQGEPVSVVESWANAALDIFGVDRVLWGSDWPVLRCAGEAREWFDCAMSIVASRGQDAVANVFGANARRAYRLR
ncbi:MAG: amidohydrolase [Paraburkholderia sp.]|nr:MAG: amidohydrolase [Paraburkholderia sp.]